MSPGCAGYNSLLRHPGSIIKAKASLVGRVGAPGVASRLAAGACEVAPQSLEAALLPQVARGGPLRDDDVMRRRSRNAEGCKSGLSGEPGKLVYGQPYRGFESHPLRHANRTLCALRISKGR